MLSFTGSLKVFVAMEPCDIRKFFESLHAQVIGHLRAEPQHSVGSRDSHETL